jgi:integrase
LRFRTVTLPAPAAKLLRDWLAYSQPRYWLFPGRRGECLSTRQAGRTVRYYLEKIGRPDLRPHSLRHSYGAIVTRQSGVWVAQKVLGHASPTTTSRFYSAFDVSDSDLAADKLEEALK